MKSTTVLCVVVTLCGLSTSSSDFSFGPNAPVATSLPKPLSHGAQNYLEDSHLRRDEETTGPVGSSGRPKPKKAAVIMTETKDGGFTFVHEGFHCDLSHERREAGRQLVCDGHECTLHKQGVWKCGERGTCYITMSRKDASCQQIKKIIQAPNRDCKPGQQRKPNGDCVTPF